MSKQTKETKIFLAQLDVFGYTLTAVGNSKGEVVRALRKEYEETPPSRRPQKESGGPRSFNNYAEYSGMRINEMSGGKVEWL